MIKPPRRVRRPSAEQQQKLDAFRAKRFAAMDKDGNGDRRVTKDELRALRGAP